MTVFFLYIHVTFTDSNVPSIVSNRKKCEFIVP